jgi:hypothetical protein
MNSIFANLKTSAAGMTPIFVGALTTLGGVAALFHIPVNGVAITGDPLTMIGAGMAMISTGLGLLAAKDGTTHSTAEQITQASVTAINK